MFVKDILLMSGSGISRRAIYSMWVVLVCFQVLIIYYIWSGCPWLALTLFVEMVFLFAAAFFCYCKTRDFNPAFLSQHSLSEWGIVLSYFFVPELRGLTRRQKFERIATLVENVQYDAQYDLRDGAFSKMWWISVGFVLFFPLIDLLFSLWEWYFNLEPMIFKYCSILAVPVITLVATDISAQGILVYIIIRSAAKSDRLK